MTDTRRRNYRGEPIRDGKHAKKCPEPNCKWCINGKAKRTHRRWIRHTWRRSA